MPLRNFFKFTGKLAIPAMLFQDNSIPKLESLEYVAWGGFHWMDDTNLYLFKTSNPEGYVISANPTPDLYVDDVKYGQPIGAIGGFGVYGIFSGEVFRSATWPYDITLFSGLRHPYAHYDEDAGQWVGDFWFSGVGATLEPRGTALNSGTEQSKTLSCKIHGYQRVGDKYGIYDGIGDKAGSTMTFGEPYWEDDAGKRFIRYFEFSATFEAAMHILGTRRIGAKFVIGNHGGESGWWEASGPVEQSSWTFAFTLPPGSDAPTQPDKTLRWGGWCEGISKVKGGMFQEAVVV